MFNCVIPDIGALLGIRQTQNFPDLLGMPATLCNPHENHVVIFISEGLLGMRMRFLETGVESCAQEVWVQEAATR